MSFYRDLGGGTHNEWGSSLKNRTKISKNTTIVTVSAVDMACWLKREVVGRHIPAGASSAAGRELPPAVVMKSDIEGHDMKVLSHIMMKGERGIVPDICIAHAWLQHIIKATRLITSCPHRPCDVVLPRLAICWDLYVESLEIHIYMAGAMYLFLRMAARGKTTLQKR